MTTPMPLPREPVFRSRRAGGPLLGVCEGLARTHQLDPLVVRLGFVIAGISGPGIIWYLLCAMWMPGETEEMAPIHAQVPRTRTWTRAQVAWLFALGALGGLIAFGSMLPAGPMPLLIVLGCAWWARRRRRRAGLEGLVGEESGRAAAAEAAWAAAEELDPAARAWQARLLEVYQGSGEIAPSPPPVVPVKPLVAAAPARTRVTRLRRPRSWVLTAVTATLAAVAFGVAFPLFPDNDPVVLGLAMALGAVGVVLVATCWWRRPHLGVTLGLVVAMSLAASTAPSVISPSGPAGRVTYATTASLPAHMTINLRETHLDLSGLEVNDDHTLALDVNASSVTIQLPPNALVEYTTRGSQIDEPGNTIAEGNASGTWRRGSGDGPVLRIVLNVTVGGVILL